MIKRTMLGFILAAVAMVTLPGIASAQANPGICSGKQIYFIVQYNDGGVDEGCAEKNDVTRETNPGLIANKLHVSCSDEGLNSGSGIPSKGDLGSSERRVEAFFFSGKKTCGDGTPIPAGGIVGLVLATGALGGLGMTRLRKRRQVEL